jgi:hypothetical protein
MNKLSKIRWLRYTSLKWLILIMIPSLLYIICSLTFNYSLLSKPTTTVVNDINISIFSSAVLLVIFEALLYRKDKRELGYLNGRYVRKYITQNNDEGLRGSDIDPNKKNNHEQTANVKYLPHYKYHNLAFYSCDNTDWSIILNYEFGGNYQGTAEYYKHGTGTSPFDTNKPKTIANINLTLNSADKITGSGSYRYEENEDYGTYNFQVIDREKKRLLVYYENILPSGLAEGYEIWEYSR